MLCKTENWPSLVYGFDKQASKAVQDWSSQRA